MTKTVKETAPIILAEVKKAKHILLHLHPMPDPDSFGSALSMKFVLEGMGKKVTVIRGDSETPEAFSHFPGFDTVVKKSFREVEFDKTKNPDAPDLFLSQDTSNLEMISRKAPEGPLTSFPSGLKVIVIDHHISNTKYGQINLVDATYPATCEMLADVFKVWNVKLTHDIALNLITGIYTDTGGFKYAGVTANTFRTIADLVELAPDFSKTIFEMENQNSPSTLAFLGYALSRVETFLDGHLAITTIPHSFIKENKIKEQDIRGQSLSNYLKSVIGWDVGASLIEFTPGNVKVSFRTRDPQKFDLSVIAERIGGGGHKAAAAAFIQKSLDEVQKMVIDSVSKSM